MHRTALMEGVVVKKNKTLMEHQSCSLPDKVVGCVRLNIFSCGFIMLMTPHQEFISTAE
jgi:hypothetical protein